jgi:hypothetical protein
MRRRCTSMWPFRRSPELAAELHHNRGQTRITIRISGGGLEELLELVARCEQHLEATKPEVHIA